MKSSPVLAGMFRHLVTFGAGMAATAGLAIGDQHLTVGSIVSGLAMVGWSVAQKVLPLAAQEMIEMGDPVQNISQAGSPGNIGTGQSAALRAQLEAASAVQTVDGPAPLNVAVHPAVQAVVNSVYANPAVAPSNAASVAAGVLASLIPFLGPAFQVSRASPRTQAQVSLGLAALEGILSVFFPHPALQPPQA